MRPLRNAPAPATATVRVAYHEGPPDIGYGGRDWRRGVAQDIPAAEWAAMKQRADCREFGFRIVAFPIQVKE